MAHHTKKNRTGGASRSPGAGGPWFIGKEAHAGPSALGKASCSPADAHWARRSPSSQGGVFIPADQGEPGPPRGADSPSWSGGSPSAGEASTSIGCSCAAGHPGTGAGGPTRLAARSSGGGSVPSSGGWMSFCRLCGQLFRDSGESF